MDDYNGNVCLNRAGERLSVFAIFPGGGGGGGAVPHKAGFTSEKKTKRYLGCFL